MIGFLPTMWKARVQISANAQTPATGCSAGPKLGEGCIRKGIWSKPCARLLYGPVGPLWWLLTHVGGSRKIYNNIKHHIEIDKQEKIKCERNHDVWDKAGKCTGLYYINRAIPKMEKVLKRSMLSIDQVLEELMLQYLIGESLWDHMMHISHLIRRS